MNRWYRIRRLRSAVFIILIGVLALLNQWNILRLRMSWPLFLIVFGLLMLAERTAWILDLREQHASQEFDSGRGTLGLSQQEPAYWSTSTPSTDAGSESFIQPHPPAPEDSGRPEDSDREDR